MQTELNFEIDGINFSLIYDVESSTVTVTATEPDEDYQDNFVGVSKVDKNGDTREGEAYYFREGDFSETLEVEVLDRLNIYTHIKYNPQSRGVDVTENGLRLN